MPCVAYFRWYLPPRCFFLLLCPDMISFHHDSMDSCTCGSANVCLRQRFDRKTSKHMISTLSTLWLHSGRSQFSFTENVPPPQKKREREEAKWREKGWMRESEKKGKLDVRRKKDDATGALEDDSSISWWCLMDRHAHTSAHKYTQNHASSDTHTLYTNI